MVWFRVRENRAGFCLPRAGGAQLLFWGYFTSGKGQNSGKIKAAMQLIAWNMEIIQAGESLPFLEMCKVLQESNREDPTSHSPPWQAQTGTSVGKSHLHLPESSSKWVCRGVAVRALSSFIRGLWCN